MRQHLRKFLEEQQCLMRRGRYASDPHSQRQAEWPSREGDEERRDGSPELQLLASPLVSSIGSTGTTMSPAVSPVSSETDSDVELMSWEEAPAKEVMLVEEELEEAWAREVVREERQERAAALSKKLPAKAENPAPKCKCHRQYVYRLHAAEQQAEARRKATESAEASPPGDEASECPQAPKLRDAEETWQERLRRAEEEEEELWQPPPSQSEEEEEPQEHQQQRQQQQHQQQQHQQQQHQQQHQQQQHQQQQQQHQQQQQQQHQQPGPGWQGPQGAVIGPFVSQEVRTAVRGGMVWHHQTQHITWASGPAPVDPDSEEARVWEEAPSRSWDPRGQATAPRTATNMAQRAATKPEGEERAVETEGVATTPVAQPAGATEPAKTDKSHAATKAATEATESPTASAGERTAAATEEGPTAAAEEHHDSPEPSERGPWEWPTPAAEQHARPRVGRQTSCPEEREKKQRPVLHRQASWPQAQAPGENPRWRLVQREDWPAVAVRAMARIQLTAKRVKRLVNEGRVRYRVVASTDRQEVFRDKMENVEKK
ncbi:skin secretory protein xP2-like [Drosophila madeirensis]|uniref:Skin secretory protein xP2-like n=1 Tax=Drosophila madeirensis TaxID=30013 RepID=A0AAU9FLU5_DROMD